MLEVAISEFHSIADFIKRVRKGVRCSEGPGLAATRWTIRRRFVCVAPSHQARVDCGQRPEITEQSVPAVLDTQSWSFDVFHCQVNEHETGDLEDVTRDARRETKSYAHPLSVFALTISSPVKTVISRDLVQHIFSWSTMVFVLRLLHAKQYVLILCTRQCCTCGQ